MKQTVSKKYTKEIRLLKMILAVELVLIVLIANFSGEAAVSVESDTTDVFCSNYDEKIFNEESVEYTTSLIDETTEVEFEFPYTDNDVFVIAKTVYGEALVTESETEMAAVVWCILNRIDDADFPNTIIEVVTAPNQFHGYSPNHPVTEDIELLVRDVLDRWVAEKNGAVDVGRVLPSDYCYFEGDGTHNHYTTSWRGGVAYDWSLISPYES